MGAVGVACYAESAKPHFNMRRVNKLLCYTWHGHKLRFSVA